MSVASLFILVIPLIRISTATDIDSLVVQLAQPRSRIRGHILESAKGNEYYSFQEIPYAAPPVGQNRFKPPLPHNGWDGILDTTRNTKKCFQPFIPHQADSNRSDAIFQSEDCLFLNVYTPVKPGSNTSLSVFLFIHGGGFISGDGTFNSVGPKYLMDGNIVLITLNYRLGPFGFLSTGDQVISGNMGLKDQLRAIEWIRDNVHLFGGDPQDIVIGGQSAGAFATGYHLLNPGSKGLVSATIQQSGSPIGVGVYVAEPRQYAMALGKLLDQSFDTDNTSSLLPVLQSASSEEIVMAASQIQAPSTISTAFVPVMEDPSSDQPIVATPMHQAFMEGNFVRVPSLIGFTSEESVILLPEDDVLIEIAASYDSDPALLIDEILNVGNRTAVGTKLKEVYTSSSFVDDLEAYVRYESDLVVILGVLRQAELAAKYVPVYLYEFSAGVNTDSRFPGVGHGYELIYLFDFPEADSYFPIDWVVDEATREVILELWWNFIKYKNPTPQDDPALRNIEWPTVKPDNLIYLSLNYSLSVESGPRNYNRLRKVLLDDLRPPFYKF